MTMKYGVFVGSRELWDLELQYQFGHNPIEENTSEDNSILNVMRMNWCVFVRHEDYMSMR